MSSKSKICAMPPSQIDFRFLSVPDLQPETFGQDAMDQEPFSRSGSSTSIKSIRQDKDPNTHVICAHDTLDPDDVARCGHDDDTQEEYLARDAYAPVNYISPEAYALLAAAEALAARRADAEDAGIMDYAFNGPSSTEESALDGMYDPGRLMPSMAPPKRFYRTFWQSASLRLLYRWTQTAKPSKYGFRSSA